MIRVYHASFVAVVLQDLRKIKLAKTRMLVTGKHQACSFSKTP